MDSGLGVGPDHRRLGRQCQGETGIAAWLGGHGPWQGWAWGSGLTECLHKWRLPRKAAASLKGSGLQLLLL